jgi:hypothetical protein
LPVRWLGEVKNQPEAAVIPASMQARKSAAVSTLKAMPMPIERVRAASSLSWASVKRWASKPMKRHWHADRHRLRCLRIKVQAERRLPGLQRGDQVRSLLAEQRCRRQFDGRVPESTSRAGWHHSWLWPQLMNTGFSSRWPDVGQRVEGAHCIRHAPWFPRWSVSRVAMIRLWRLTSGWRDMKTSFIGATLVRKNHSIVEAARFALIASRVSAAKSKESAKNSSGGNWQ